MSKRNQKGYYILPFKEEDMLNDMDLLEKMEDVNWEKFKKNTKVITGVWI